MEPLLIWYSSWLRRKLIYAVGERRPAGHHSVEGHGMLVLKGFCCWKAEEALVMLKQLMQWRHPRDCLRDGLPSGWMSIASKKVY